MTGRVEGKVALVMGGGQTPGQTVGNGRAAAIVSTCGAQPKVDRTAVDVSWTQAQRQAEDLQQSGAPSSWCGAWTGSGATA